MERDAVSVALLQESLQAPPGPRRLAAIMLSNAVQAGEDPNGFLIYISRRTKVSAIMEEARILIRELGIDE